jgi:hypothetical protein
MNQQKQYTKKYGFILTRHVNSEKTNKYWNHSVKCIRRYYPFQKIVIIDDNSNSEFVKAFTAYDNIEIIQSEFPGRGELLPFIYLLKHRFFENAIIIHDSVFFHKRINFNSVRFPVLPLWHFNRYVDQPENKKNNLRIARNLSNNSQVIDNLNSIINSSVNFQLPWRRDQEWSGCFGVQCFINYHFLEKLEAKYKITSLLSHVKNRKDRCSLERIIGTIFNIECPPTKIYKSLFGDIFSYQRFGYTFEEYEENLKNKKVAKPVIKVWTGR